jgi:hypothetical protein
MLTIHEDNVNLAARGAIIHVKLWAPKDVKTSFEPINAFAEIDTSIGTTRIQEGVATSLGLTPIGTIKTTSSTTLSYETNLYRIRLIFPQSKVAFEVDAIEVPFMLRPASRVKCRIGRDILKHTTLTYNGRSNSFSLDFRLGE